MYKNSIPKKFQHKKVIQDPPFSQQTKTYLIDL